MKISKLSLYAIFLLGFGLTGVQAQQAFRASVGNASGSGGSVSYRVGQVGYTTIAATNGSVVPWCMAALRNFGANRIGRCHWNSPDTFGVSQSGY